MDEDLDLEQCGRVGLEAEDLRPPSFMLTFAEAVEPWRLARSIDVLRDEVNARWPRRSVISDGTIGDAAHATRTSDHNPFVKVDGIGVVRAFDITHDPFGGPSGDELARHFAELSRNGDRRVRYVIWDRRIYNIAIADRWRPYSGPNPHDRHLHLSVSLDAEHFDSIDTWGIAQEDTGMIYIGTHGDGQAVACQVLANRALAARHDRMTHEGLETAGDPLKLDDYAGPITHGRVNWILDHYFADIVSRRKEGTITPGGLALLSTVETIERDRLRKVLERQAAGA